MPCCKYHDICGLPDDADHESQLCVLHSQNRTKDRQAFAKALDTHRKDKGDYFQLMVFPEEVNFSGATFTKRANFSGATFQGEANFRGATFELEPDFRNTMFEQKADFAGATFNGKSNILTEGRIAFSDLALTSLCPIFPDIVLFLGVTFGGEANFTGAEFKAPVIFGPATFKGEAKFDHATFEGTVIFQSKAMTKTLTTAFKMPASFTETTFRGWTDFEQTIFEGEANFAGALFEGTAIFANATFKESADFTPALTTNLKDGKSPSTSEIKFFYTPTTFGGEVHFTSAVFLSKALFEQTIFSGNKVSFKACHFSEHAHFTFTKSHEYKKSDHMFSDAKQIDFSSVSFKEGEEIIFSGVDLRRCKFIKTDMRKMHIIDVDWPWIRGRLAVYDETILRKRLKNKEELPWEDIERLYRQLKQNYEDRRNHEPAGYFHYGEKEMRRQNPKTPWGLWILLWLYRIVSGYGERAIRPLVWAGVVLVVFALIYLLYGLSPAKQVSNIPTLSLKDTATWGQALTYSLQIMTWQKPQYYTLLGFWITVLYTLHSLFGPLLFGLFALAVRQRLKR